MRVWRPHLYYCNAIALMKSPIKKWALVLYCTVGRYVE